MWVFCLLLSLLVISVATVDKAVVPAVIIDDSLTVFASFLSFLKISEQIISPATVRNLVFFL